MPARPDSTFHASAKLARHAPPGTVADTVMLGRDFSRPDPLAVVDLSDAMRVSLTTLSKEHQIGQKRYRRPGFDQCRRFRQLNQPLSFDQ
jgi:hypothetical protein